MPSSSSPDSEDPKGEPQLASEVVADLSQAYAAAISEIPGLDTSAMRGAFGGISRVLDNDTATRSVAAEAAAKLINSPAVVDHAEFIASIPFTDSAPTRTAKNTKRIAEAMKDLHEVTGQLVQLTSASLALSEAQREAAARQERFARRATWASIVIGAGSLAAAVVAIVVSL